MKKLIEQIKEKAVLGIVMSMIGIGGTFLWSFGKEILGQPDTNKELRANDSITKITLTRLSIKVDSISANENDDYKAIVNIKEQLGIK